MTEFVRSGSAVLGFPAGWDTTESYVSLDQFKSTADLAATSYLDLDILVALKAASRAIDAICNRRFWSDPDANQVRYYSPVGADRLFIDDLLTMTTLKTDSGGDDTFETTWAAADYVLEPINAPANGEPWTAIKARQSAYFPTSYVKTVELTGKFGWAEVPAAITEACTIMTGRYLKRSREAPFGAAEALALGGAAIRLTGRDPDVTSLLSPYMRNTV